MEEVVVGHIELAESQRGIDGYVVLKPSILTDGEGKGIDVVRAETGDGPPVGYSIDREMVGLWMFHRLIEEEEARGEWKDARVTITY